MRQPIVRAIIIITLGLGFAYYIIPQPAQAITGPTITPTGVGGSCTEFTFDVKATLQNGDIVVWSWFKFWDYGQLALFDANGNFLGENTLGILHSGGIWQDAGDYQNGIPASPVTTHVTIYATITGATRPFSVRVYDTPTSGTYTTGTLVGQMQFDPAHLPGGSSCSALPGGSSGSGGSSSGGSGKTTPVNAAPPEIAPDSRMNWKHGDTYAIVYPVKDANGDFSIHLYCLEKDPLKGVLALVISKGDVGGVEINPEGNTEVKHTEVCNAYFHILSTGEYQITVGPDFEGKHYAYIFKDLQGSGFYAYEFNTYDIVN